MDNDKTFVESLSAQTDGFRTVGTLYVGYSGIGESSRSQWRTSSVLAYGNGDEAACLVLSALPLDMMQGTSARVSGKLRSTKRGLMTAMLQGTGSIGGLSE